MSTLRGVRQLALNVEGGGCALQLDGHVRCWGRVVGNYGRPADWAVEIRGVASATQIAVDSDEGCARLADGTVSCWGCDRSHYQCGADPVSLPGVSDASEVAMGMRRICARSKDDSVRCWDARALPPGGSGPGALKASPFAEGVDRATQIVLVHRFGCVLRTDHRVVCVGAWPDGSHEPPDHPPTVIDGLTNVVRLVGSSTLNGGTVCALDAAGRASCFGDNSNGLLGDGTFASRGSAVRVVDRFGALPPWERQDGETLTQFGGRVYRMQACVVCHSNDGSRGTGPTWAGLFGSRVMLKDGSSVVVDESYVRESIRKPTAKVDANFNPVMPPYLDLTDSQMDGLVAYIQSLQGADHRQQK